MTIVVSSIRAVPGTSSDYTDPWVELPYFGVHDGKPEMVKALEDGWDIVVEHTIHGRYHHYFLITADAYGGFNVVSGPTEKDLSLAPQEIGLSAEAAVDSVIPRYRRPNFNSRREPLPITPPLSGWARLLLWLIGVAAVLTIMSVIG